VTEEELATALSALPGVATVVAAEDNGAPEAAWGDSFFFYDPADEIPPDRRFPFATIVVSDYPGFDAESRLDRPGVYRLNLSVGRDRFREVFGFPPAEFADHRDGFDFAELDRVLPHPAYGQQAWVSILVPGERTGAQALDLIAVAHERARAQHRRR
jgi:hypothetical protein